MPEFDASVQRHLNDLHQREREHCASLDQAAEPCAALTASAPMLIAGLGMLLLPHLMPVWAFVGGCAQGASLVVALALIALRGRDSAETVVLSGVAQSFGYLIASLGPLMFGVLVQATGGHHVPLMVFTFVAFLQCVVAVIVGRPSKM